MTAINKIYKIYLQMLAHLLWRENLISSDLLDFSASVERFRYYWTVLAGGEGKFAK